MTSEEDADVDEAADLDEDDDADVDEEPDAEPIADQDAARPSRARPARWRAAYEPDLAVRLAVAEQRIELLERIVTRERAARVARRDLQRLAAESVAAGSVDEVATAIVRGSSEVLASPLTTLALPEPDGRIRFVHLDDIPDEVRARWDAATPDVEVPLVRALDADATWIELLDHDALAAWPALAPDVERAGLGSYVAVPLRSRRSRVPIAALGFGYRTPTELDGLDRALVAELSELAGEALERTAELQHTRDIAETLQHALLPRRLPRVEGLTLRALYRPTAERADVGGDWYDVIDLADDAIGLVVGDVAGHDTSSAAEMGRIRHVLASHLLERGDPGEALTIADRYFAHVEESSFATALVMVLRPSVEEIVLATAGHPPPLLVTVASEVSLLAIDPGPPIGSGLGGHRSGCHDLPAGASVVAMTDGAFERRGMTIDESITELAARLAAVPDPGPTTLLRVLRDHLEDPDRSDDAAVLIATRT